MCTVHYVLYVLPQFMFDGHCERIAIVRVTILNPIEALKPLKKTNKHHRNLRPLATIVYLKMVYIPAGTHIAEYAETGRSRCKRCCKCIAEGTIRLGTYVQVIYHNVPLCL